MKLYTNLLFFFILSSSILSAQDEELSIIRFDDIPNNITVYSIEVDPANHKWISSNQGVYQIGQNDETTVHLAGVSVKDVAFTSKGIFAASHNKIVSLDGSTEYKLPMAEARIADMDVKGTEVYIATDKGLFILNMGSEQFSHKTTRNSKLGSNIVNFVNVDNTDIVWLGTQSGEIRIDGKKWKNYHKGYNVIDHFENTEGIWFVGEGEMWLIDYYNREYDAGLDKSVYSGRLNDFAIDTKGRLYFASDKLVRYNPYEDSFLNFTEDASILSKKCSAIVADVKDEVWIGTAGAGVYRLGVGKKAIKDLNAAILIDKEITCASEQSAGLKVSVSGGEGPYNYEWSSPSMTGAEPSNLGPGMYALTVTDAANNKFMTNIELKAPKPISIELVNATRISKPGGRDGLLEISVSGGTGDFKYQWEGGGRSPVKSKLGAGSYSVTVTDENGCSAEGEYEVLREKFIPDLDISKIQIGKTLRINELNFKADSSVVTAESYDVLEEVLTFLQQNEDVVVEIGGHTNTIPSQDYCLRLSTDRARNIAEYFYNHGVSEKRLSYKGYGKSQPLTNSRSKAGQQKNQRVEIKIISM